VISVGNNSFILKKLLVSAR